MPRRCGSGCRKRDCGAGNGNGGSTDKGVSGRSISGNWCRWTAALRPAHIKWLLDSDPAIRWQVMSDLTDEAPDVIAAERSRIATEGWGAQLLAAQSPAGYWGDPRKWDLVPLNSLVVLKGLGLDPASKQ